MRRRLPLMILNRGLLSRGRLLLGDPASDNLRGLYWVRVSPLANSPGVSQSNPCPPKQTNKTPFAAHPEPGSKLMHCWVGSHVAEWGGGWACLVNHSSWWRDMLWWGRREQGVLVLHLVAGLLTEGPCFLAETWKLWVQQGGLQPPNSGLLEWDPCMPNCGSLEETLERTDAD